MGMFPGSSIPRRGRAGAARTQIALALLLASAAAAGCGTPRDPVLALVDDLRAAAEARDAPAIGDRLSDDFRGAEGVDKAEATATLRRYFAAYETVRLAVYDVAVSRPSEAEATVGFRVEFRGDARRIGGLDGFLPPSAAERFDLRLVRRGTDWKVAAGDWRAVGPSPAP